MIIFLIIILKLYLYRKYEEKDTTKEEIIWNEISEEDWMKYLK